jgi:hypothetical protein
MSGALKSDRALSISASRIHFSDLCLKAYPDKNRDFFSSLYSREPEFVWTELKLN